MTKSQQLSIRISPERKERWMVATKALCYSSLTDMIEDAVEEHLESLRHSQGMTTKQAVAILEEVEPVVSNQMQIPDADTRQCAVEMTHRKGFFCSTCKRVI